MEVLEREQEKDSTWATLLVLPLLLVSLSLLKDTSCLIQWAPVLGESGCMYILFPVSRKKTHTMSNIYNILKVFSILSRLESY